MAHGYSTVEDMVMTNPDALHAAYHGRSVFVTGHTGFKGAWLAMWLARLGARTTGYALPPDTIPNLFDLAHVEDALIRHVVADIRDPAALTTAMQKAAPDIVFHLAAQPLVRFGYREPATTWSTNVMGTVNLLEAVRACPSVKAVVVVTTDKCYQNRETQHAYIEDDPLGGDDPYSASKAGAELVVQSFRKSFFSDGATLLASARAGNVFGGGDWCADRLIPDAVRALSAGQALEIRNPAATRPWQHVLEALHGYLLLGSRLLAGDNAFASAFNFGPDHADNLPVADILRQLQQHWPELAWRSTAEASNAPHEAQLLNLDSGKAHRMLEWVPRWGRVTGLEHTASWYRTVLNDPQSARQITEQQLDQFCA